MDRRAQGAGVCLRTASAVMGLAMAATLLLTAGPLEAQRGGSGGGVGKVEFAALFMPDAVVVDTDRDMVFCLINRGAAGSLVRDGVQDDHLTLAVPLGTADSDLEANGVGVGCTPPADWGCDVNALADTVQYTLGPAGTTVAVPAGDTVCFDMTGVRVNAAEGLSLSALLQSISSSRAKPLLTSILPVYKSAQGQIEHDDLADVREDQHHVRYTDGEALQAVLDGDGAGSGLDADTVDGHEGADLEESSEIDADVSAHAGVAGAHHAKTTTFAELTDAATDAQVPNDITVNHAATAGDADTVDGHEGGDLEESSEIDADVSAHAGEAGVHHAKTTTFAELTDTATDAQIPDTITVNHAATAGHASSADFASSASLATSAGTADSATTAGNADTVDNRHASELTRARGSLGLNYIIALEGIFPSRNARIDDGPQNSGLDPFLGEVILFGGNFAPRGWALCEGQLLQINQYQALFSILGTTFGGDGRTTFGLPDLRGRVPLGPGTGPGGTNVRLGEKCGTPGCAE